VSIGLSKALEDSYWTFLMNRIGQGLGKRVIRTGGGEFESASHVDLDVVQSRVAPDMVQIRFTLPEEEGTVAIVIFNALGEVVFYPYSGSLVGAPALISYQAPRSGTYFAGLVVQGKVLATRKFIISK
jgi:hypothetical protein